MLYHAKKSILASLLILTVLFVAGCGGSTNSAATKPKEPDTLKVGVTNGPHAEIMEVVKKIAEKDGLQLKIVEFSDYIAPNAALNEGEIDANSYQHQPWLDNQIKDRKYELVSIAKTIIAPMGIYSKKVKKLDEVQPGATVAIPNDPTNGGRALVILEKSGLIKLKPGVGSKAIAVDIVENPKNIKIKELDAAQIPRSLEDVDVAAINTNYAMTAGFLPTRDAIVIEGGDSPYANVLAVRTKDKDKPVFKKLIKAYQSAEVKQFVEDKFKGSLIPAW